MRRQKRLAFSVSASLLLLRLETPRLPFSSVADSLTNDRFRRAAPIQVQCRKLTTGEIGTWTPAAALFEDLPASV